MSAPALDARIARFIGRHHVMTLATVGPEGPHCSSLFYAYDPQRNRFVVTSSEKTLHVAQLLRDSRVAGAVALESRIIGKLQGVQWRGEMKRPAAGEMAWARETYLKKFPFALLMDLELWVIEPDYMKLTDNRLGFGKKLIWEAEK